MSGRYTIKVTEQKWNKSINELWHINFYEYGYFQLA